MEIRALFVPTNCFPQALCSLNFNTRQLLSLHKIFLAALWAQKHPPRPLHLSARFLFHPSPAPVLLSSCAPPPRLRSHTSQRQVTVGCDMHSAAASQVKLKRTWQLYNPLNVTLYQGKKVRLGAARARPRICPLLRSRRRIPTCPRVVSREIVLFFGGGGGAASEVWYTQTQP